MIRFKSATTKDIDLIRSLANEAFRAAYNSILSPQQIEYMMDMMYSHSSLLDQLEDDNCSFYFVFDNNRVCGYFSIVKIEADNYLLDKLYLLDTAQGKGIGKASVDFIKEQVLKCSKSKITKLHLHVNRKNKAIGFCKSQGFEIILSDQFDIGNGFVMDDHIIQVIIKRV